ERTELGEPTVQGDAKLLLQVLTRDGAGGHAHHRLAGRGTPATTVVAAAVFHQIRVVRMAGTELVLEGLVVLRLGVGVLDQEADGRAGGPALEHAGEDLHRVRLVALRGVARGAGAAAVHVALDVGLRELHSRRAAVHDAAQRRSMALAERGD